MKDAGVDLSRTGVCRESTGLAFIQVEDSGENTIAIVKGANGEVSTQTAETALSDLSANDILLLQQEVPLAALVKAVDLAKSSGAKSILNTAPFQKDYIALADKVDIVISNETEFDELLPGEEPRAARAAKYVNETGKLLIVTLGADGAMIAEPDCEPVIVPSPKLDHVVDTTGAGDTFCGYFCKMLADGADPVTATNQAVKAASLACCKNGAQPSIPFASEIE